jgi:cobalamin transport system ATP-binding protein
MTGDRGAVFEVAGLSFTYRGATRPAVADAEFAVGRGRVLGIIGPNGSGKSTLLRLLLGVLRPSAGRVLYEGRDVHVWNRRALARDVGVVGQLDEMLYPIPVVELVAMGRYPHLGPWRRAGQRDVHAIDTAMRRCSIEALADRPASQLSAGELQRARIARALAQEPAVLVLDEPTAQLDIGHEMAIFELLAGLCNDDGATVVVVTHNLNLAARYASDLLLLDAGRIVGQGSPDRVLERATIERVYGWPVRVVRHPGPGPDAGAPQIIPLTGPERTVPRDLSTNESPH